MIRTLTKTAAIAACCAVAAAGLTGCDDDSGAFPFDSPEPRKTADAFTGTKKIKVAGRSVNVSCAGGPAKDEPVIVLMAGLGDGLGKMAALQKTLSEENRVCSYDRLGEGASEAPKGPQSFADTGKVLSGVLDRVAGDGRVVLAGHSLGGMIAARYAPDHKDRVKGLVLMDATSPTPVADIENVIPESATGPGAQVRAETLAVNGGKNAEKLVITDGKVRSAGNIPAEVIRHGKQYLAAVPQYGPALERGWTAGQRKWLGVSKRAKLSTATGSEHYIYVDRPDLAVKAIQRVTAQAATAA
ncbi:alpha/beta fold hydrolase [Actinomadura sp. NAK00032]|uniref:alpha/beta fold hydrolase n=1 Tax=Actinomadura sp. NAK00032 TaxID=2742128 RepID=UPI00158FEE69|nr:alpha/beta fold hydrolase [Actinomadura sp. NAK00032]QKW38233.1 alpha/beta fold hydrolase [Actinomadura sp. NAK00032]